MSDLADFSQSSRESRHSNELIFLEKHIISFRSRSKTVSSVSEASLKQSGKMGFLAEMGAQKSQKFMFFLHNYGFAELQALTVSPTDLAHAVIA